IDSRVRWSMYVQGALHTFASVSGIIANRALMAGHERWAAVSLGITGLVGAAASTERVAAFRRMDKIVSQYSRAVGAEPRDRYQWGDMRAHADSESYGAPSLASLAFFMAGFLIDHEVTNNNSSDPQGGIGLFGGTVAYAGGALGIISEAKSRELKKTFRKQLANIEFSVNLPLTLEAQSLERRAADLVGESGDGRFQFRDETGQAYEVALGTEETEWSGRRRSASKKRKTTISIKEVSQGDGDAQFEEIQINTQVKVGDRFSPRSSVAVTVGHYDKTGERYIMDEDTNERAFEERDERLKRMRRVLKVLNKITPESRIDIVGTSAF
ncbi:MAG TPA: hypothetical protein VLF20_00325, partial [Patescibacteria group bacterium]|nr:hypothetical protein [Patescibacteria group bacterium]